MCCLVVTGNDGNKDIDMITHHVWRTNEHICHISVSTLCASDLNQFIVMIWPVAPCHSQLAAVIDGWLWEYGVIS